MAVFNERLVSFILGKEGGWVNDPDDKGGETNRGITLNTFNFLCKKVLGLEPAHDLFMKLTHEQVSKFVEWYWNDIDASLFASQAVAEFMTDWNWGSGASAKKCLQRVLARDYKQSISVNGVVGPHTIAAANSIKGLDLLNSLCAERLTFYERIAPAGSGNSKFLKGWKRRAVDQYNLIKADA